MTKTCCTCKRIKPLCDFYKRKQSRDGHQSSCKSCMADTYTKCRNNRLDHYTDVQKQRYDKIRDRYREWKRKNGCVCCAETEPVCLQLHHLDPIAKEFAPADLLKYSWKKLMKEASKCVVVCGNCHAKIHGGIVTKTKLGQSVFVDNLCVVQPGSIAGLEPGDFSSNLNTETDDLI